ncbi:glycoside hydrolase family 16 protein [Amniculicola lignicola CBS 123094]|uniref:endo-1,3(4)-beta-glucanase n=1 Tax=Amniculicola lignicola CBS 123094 TaxID=1392246 RepID=A0A6A5WUY8_9PLEO|nr:glycoside hydrolase family 16 protein [Amniculicola lignicola CBS 123094]
MFCSLPSLTALLLTLAYCTAFVKAAYSLVDNYSGASLISGFNFFSEPDPTHGFVRYLNQNDAQSQGLLSVSGSSVYIGVDSKNKAPNGRASVRLESKKLYKKGLFILDLAHMPSSTCGTWPAFWTWGSGKTWPELGEIDIIEGVHTNTANTMVLHTADGCSISGTGLTGVVKTKNCYINAPGQSPNAGCAIESSSSSSFGTPFNAAGGGVYAMEWTSSGIKIWHWLRDAIPADVKSGNNPNPGGWGTPQGNFAGGCNFDTKFGDQKIVLDTTFCGDWAGNVWTSNPTCKSLAATCNDYVANNPGAFAESYWRVNYLKIFRQT